MKKKVLECLMTGLLIFTVIPLNVYAESRQEFTSGPGGGYIDVTDMPEEVEEESPELKETEKQDPVLSAELVSGGTNNLVEWTIGPQATECSFTVKVTVKVKNKPKPVAGAMVFDSKLNIKINNSFTLGESKGFQADDFKEVDDGYMYSTEISCSKRFTQLNTQPGDEPFEVLVEFAPWGIDNVASVSGRDTGIKFKINPYPITWPKATAQKLSHNSIGLNYAEPKGMADYHFFSGSINYAYDEKAAGQTEVVNPPGDEKFSTSRTFDKLKEDTDYYVWMKVDLYNGYTNAISPATIIRTKAVNSIECLTPPKLDYKVGEMLDPTALSLKFVYSDNSFKSEYTAKDMDDNWSFYIGEDKIENLQQLPMVTIKDNGKKLTMAYTKTNGSTVTAELGTLSVSKLPQEPIDVSDSPQNLTYGASPFLLTVSGGSGSGTDLSYEVTEGGEVLRVVNGMLEVTGAGDAKVIVTKAGDDTYAPIKSDEVSIHVNKAQSEITLEDGWFYTGSVSFNPELKGVPGGKKPTGKITYTWYEDEQGNKLLNGTGEEASRTGSYYVKASMAEDSNYLSSESKIAKIQLHQYIPATPDPLPENIPEGSDKKPDGTYVTPNGTQVKTDGIIILPDGTELIPVGENKPFITKDGTVTTGSGIEIDVNGNITVPGDLQEDSSDDTVITVGDSGQRPKLDPQSGTITTVEGSTVISPDGEGGKIVRKPEVGTTVSKEGVITYPDGTIIDIKGNTNYVDGSIFDRNGQVVRPAIPVFKDSSIVNKNNTIIAYLQKECRGAQGYDYVISENPNSIVDKDYLQVNKNQLQTRTDFRYIQKGVYYIYCHAWFRGEDGKKHFSNWSDAYQVEVTAVTPQTPKIERVTVKGNTVTVVYTEAIDATGYDLVLGKAVKNVYGERRPVSYENLVIKVKNGNRVTAVFKNVKKGIYYVGLHAYNRTSIDGTKVFSPWSNIKKVTIK